MSEEMMRRIISEVIAECLGGECSALPDKGIEIPVGVSGRHVHLTEKDVEALFGKGHTLTKKRDISQPGQFLCEERVTLIGPKGVFRNVAVLGPVRQYTQAEISLSDARALGADPPVALSGELKYAADVTIASETACIRAVKSLIVAKSHIHMSSEEAKRAGVQDGDLVDILMQTERPVTFRDMPVRAGDDHRMEMHIDFDEANACLCRSGDKAVLLRKTDTRTDQTQRRTAQCKSSVGGRRESCVSQKKEEQYIVEDSGTGSRFVTEQQVKAAVQKGCKAMLVPRRAILSALAGDYARQHRIRIDFQP